MNRHSVRLLDVAVGHGIVPEDNVADDHEISQVGREDCIELTVDFHWIIHRMPVLDGFVPEVFILSFTSKWIKL